MKIAFLIVGHKDPELIARVAKKLASFHYFEVFIHYDGKFDLTPLQKLVKNFSGITLLHDRHEVYWGGFSSVQAILKLLRVAFEKSKFERFVLFQGADYPIVANTEIRNFFLANQKTEFIRASNISMSKKPIYFMKNRCFWFYDRPNIFKKVINNLNFWFPLKLRKSFIFENQEKISVYFGAAQWAITRDCANYVLNFIDDHPKFVSYMKSVFCPDEVFFHTIIYNSDYRNKTLHGDSEPCVGSIEEIRNLHYFEYPASKIKVFKEEHFDLLLKQDCLFFRKVDSTKSVRLLDKIDELHSSDMGVPASEC